MLVVTTDDIPGYEIRQVLGEAIGVTGRTRNPYREGVRKLHGGGNPQLVRALTRWRLDAVDELIRHARSLGANAVVGMRFDARNVTDMWTEICAYGTAVVAVPAAAPKPAPPPADLAGEPEPAGQPDRDGQSDLPPTLPDPAVSAGTTTGATTVPAAD